jgi:REP element-mobilizing transposase RayT
MPPSSATAGKRVDCFSAVALPNAAQQSNCWETSGLFFGSCTAEYQPAVQLLGNPGKTKVKAMPNAYRVFTDQNYAYFVTWTIVEWLPIFAEDSYRKIILDSLEYLRTNKNTQLNAFVVMSTHAHAILWPDHGVNLSDVMRDFKRFTSRAISAEATRQGASEFIKTFEKARAENRAQDVSQYQVWQEGSHPEAIFTEKFARQKMDYLHMNPVRAGLVKTADEWPYSSARAYMLGEKTYPTTDILFTR